MIPADLREKNLNANNGWLVHLVTIRTTNAVLLYPLSLFYTHIWHNGASLRVGLA